MSFLRGPGAAWLRDNLPRIPLLLNLAWGLFRDPRVPQGLKAVLLGVLVYVASPIDLIPDFIPLIGQVDDLLILLAALEVFVRLAPADVVTELEERYVRGHRPLRDDLELVEASVGRLWAWARRTVSTLSTKYGSRVSDDAYVKDLERRTRAEARARD